MLLLFGAAGVFCAELLWVYPATAADIFSYVADGQLLALHQVNPFTVAPKAFAGDAIVRLLAYAGEPAQYGPLWVLLGGGIALFAQGNLLGQVLLYKLVAALAHICSAAVVYRIACRLGNERCVAQASAFLFAWNPLLLWEMVGNAHNDGLMMLFGLVAVWLFVCRRDLLVLAAIAAGALIKLPVGLMGPVLFVGVFRRSWARAVAGALLGFALVAVIYRPFWVGIDTLTVFRRTDLFTASLASVLRLATAPSLGLDDATTLARTASLTLFAIVAVVSVLQAMVANDACGDLLACYVMLLAALLLLTTWFQAWYVVWPFAIGAALPSGRRHMEVALLSLGGMLQYLVFIYFWGMGVFPPVENLGVEVAAYAAIVGPVAVALGVRFVAQRTGLRVELRSR